MAGDNVCKTDAKAIAKELDAGELSLVDLRPCVNSAVKADERYEKYATELNKAGAKGDHDAWFKTYGELYRDIVGPEQTKFWNSVNADLSPEGLCHLELVWSEEFPKIAEHVQIVCKELPPMS
jgi:hypothetical protein